MAGRTITTPANDGNLSSSDVRNQLQILENEISGTSPSAGYIPIAALNATGSPSSTTFLRGDGSWQTVPQGTVTAVSVATANGISGTSSGGATPALTLSLGAITPTSVSVAPATGEAITLNSSYSTAAGSVTNSPTLSLVGTAYADSAGTLAAETFQLQHTFTGGSGSTPSISKTLFTVPTLGFGGSTQVPQVRFNTTSATSSVTTVSSPTFITQGTYWNGSAAVSYGGYFQGVVDSTGPAGHFEMGLFNNGTTTAQLKLLSTGNLQLITAGSTLSLYGSSSGSTALQASSTASGTLTLPAATDTVAVLGTAQTFTAQEKFNNIIDVNNAVSVSSNAGTVPVTYRLSTFTNSSAATMAITITTTNAVDGQMLIVRIYDFSGVAQTIGWTNTENSSVSAPTTSNGSTTLPLTVGFMYNSATSKWRCIASA